MFCWFTTKEQVTNGPGEGSWFSGFQYKLNDKWWTQLAIPIGLRELYMRSNFNGVIQPWHTVTV